MAKRTGLCQFVGRDSGTLTIKVKGKLEVYRNLKFYDFTSDRKMMTRVVQNIETNEVTVLCKGADSSIFKRCLPFAVYLELQRGNYGEDSSKVRESYEAHFSKPEKNLVKSIDEFAKHGYRTLAFATRKLPSADLDGFI
jgi:magnesium-transporting ATPase (P-type)